MLQYSKSGGDGNAANNNNASNKVGSIEVLKIIEKLPQDAKLIRFFERDGAYDVYGEAALQIATILRTHSYLTEISTVSVLAVLPQQLSIALRELVTEYRIEIWAFNNARRSWKVSLRASPGNLEQIESLLTDEDLPTTPIIVSAFGKLIEGEQRIGVAMVDVGRMCIGWANFIDNDSFSNLESLLVQLEARECIFPKDLGLVDNPLFSSSEVIGTVLAPNEFESESWSNDLQRLLLTTNSNNNDPANLGDISVETGKALTGIINYLGLLASDSNLGIFRKVELNLDRFMKLDETAIKSLCIFGNTKKPSSSAGSGTLFGLLDHCKTKQGSRLLSQWLRQPLMDLEELTKRQEIVQLLVQSPIERQFLRDNILRGIPDTSRITRKLVKGKANIQDLVLLYTAITKIGPIHDALLPLANPSSMDPLLLNPLRRSSHQLAKFAELIESTVDFEALKRHEYIIKADFHADLAEVNAAKEGILDAIEKEFNRVSRLVGLEKGKKIKLERNSVYGYFFRVSRLDATAITNLSNGESFNELAALKSGIYFASKSLSELSIKYDELGNEYGEKQGEMVKEMVRVAKTYRRPFEDLNELLAKVDIFQSLAFAAVTAPLPYIRPKLLPLGKSPLLMTEARHPCLESLTCFIPNDVYFDQQSCFQIITGPNMGGKSTFIRTAALIVLMAQIGSFVPCTTAEIPIMDAILVRVGAGDSILKGISTFMAEMLETSSILRTVTLNSFVVIDELGRGTSTSEGFGLAWAISKRLAAIGCYSFFATHFHELTQLSAHTSGVKNLFVEAIMENDDNNDKDRDQKKFDNLLMTFKVKDGICDQSFGIQCAEMAKFPPKILDMAKIMLRDLEGTAFTEEQAKQGLDYLQSSLSCGHESLENAPFFVKCLVPSMLLSSQK